MQSLKSPDHPFPYLRKSYIKVADFFCPALTQVKRITSNFLTHSAVISPPFKAVKESAAQGQP
jgi:hypothetical protein